MTAVAYGGTGGEAPHPAIMPLQFLSYAAGYFSTRHRECCPLDLSEAVNTRWYRTLFISMIQCQRVVPLGEVEISQGSSGRPSC
jgi:hypothetical protein